MSLMIFVAIYYILTEFKVKSFIHADNLPTIKELWMSFLIYIPDSEFWYSVIASLFRVFVGFTTAILIAIPLGLMMGLYTNVYDFLYALTEILRPIPNVAWVPIAIIIFPHIEMSIYFITFIGAFFPILLNTIKGVQTIEHRYVQQAQLLGLNKVRTITHVIFPAALPLIFIGMSIGLGVSWLGLIVAESTYGTDGIGYFTFKNLQLVDYQGIVIGMMVIGLLGMMTNSVVTLFSHYINAWHFHEKKIWN